MLEPGKGKLVDILAQRVQLCARFNGGANAGHTLVVEGKKRLGIGHGTFTDSIRCRLIVIGSNLIMQVYQYKQYIKQVKTRHLSNVHVIYCISVLLAEVRLSSAALRHDQQGLQEPHWEWRGGPCAHADEGDPGAKGLRWQGAGEDLHLHQGPRALRQPPDH